VTERTTQQRKARRFDIPRHGCGDTIWAHELQNVVEFRDPISGETVPVLKQMQAEVAKRTSGPTGLQASMEMTWERLRVGAIHGIVRDADNTTIYNWFTEFGISQPSEVAFNLTANTAGTVRPNAASVKRGMMRASKGAIMDTTKIYALCGDNFFDKLVTHTDVEKTYLNWSAAQEMRQGTAFEALYFAGIYWFNYRGTDDNTATTGVAVDPDKVKFFPVDAPGVFQVAYAPGESFQWVNQPGKKEYVIPILDRDRNAFFRQELYSYPLHICTRPEVLYSGRVGS
jgi:hypothetical protein